jgi:hypothetical protein
MNHSILILMTGYLLAVTQCSAGAPKEKTVTVLFDEATVELEECLVDGYTLWVAADQVSKANGFTPKPEGFCSAELCIPVPKSADWRMQHNGKEYFNVTRFAEKVNQAVAVAESQATWSFGAVPSAESGHLASGIAPDFELPDREGNEVSLSDFRGKKVLLLTWASW